MAKPARFTVRFYGPLFHPDFFKILADRLDVYIKQGIKEVIYPRMKRIIPVRTGRLKRNFRFGEYKKAYYIYFTRRGFYWHFVANLPPEFDRLVSTLFPQIAVWAFRRALKDAVRLTS